MSDAINTQNRLRNTGVSGDTKAGSTAKTNRTVELSSTTLIEELSEQIKNLPEVNEARVEAIKQAIGKGEYQTDAEVIARKYSEIEKLLP
jgi:negative regulator of flagellin synthesis FlgM